MAQRTTIGFQDPMTNEVRTVRLNVDHDDPATAYALAHTKLIRALVHRTMLAERLSPVEKVDLVIEIAQMDTWDATQFDLAA